MTNDQLRYLLNKFDLSDCTPIIENYIYYINTSVKQRCSSIGGSYRYITDSYEFIIVAENGVKQAIILRCGEVDLHWYVLRAWRNQHVLSNALRTGIIHKVWPKNTSITCCCSYGENEAEKKQMTLHLAKIAGLNLRDNAY